MSDEQLETPTESQGYFADTQRPIYTLLLTLPFLIVYELGVLIGGYHGNFSINGGDWIIRLFFSNIVSMHGATLSILVMGVIFLIYSARQGASWKWNTSTYVFTLLESVIWAVLLVFIAGAVNRMFFMSVPGPENANNGDLFGLKAVGNWFQRITLFCGAGVFEELVFRVMLLLPLYWFISYSDRIGKIRGIIAASIISALIFSAFHYRIFTGSGDNFSVTSFTFRFLAGLYFTALVYGRNFGVAVASHAVYDIIVGIVPR